MERRPVLGRLAGAIPDSATGVARMLGAASADVAGAVDPRRLIARPPTVDPLDLRDPEYIRRTLPALRAMSELYFRADVRGLDHVPARGPVLLVGNHSGGTLIADTFVLAQAFYDRFGPDRVFHQLAHDLVFKAPGVRALLIPYGTVPASPENMRRVPWPGTPRCSCTPGATTRPTARPGTPGTSTSPIGRGSCGSRSSWACRSFRS